MEYLWRTSGPRGKPKFRQLASGPFVVTVASHRRPSCEYAQVAPWSRSSSRPLGFDSRTRTAPSLRRALLPPSATPLLPPRLRRGTPRVASAPPRSPRHTRTRRSRRPRASCRSRGSAARVYPAAGGERSCVLGAVPPAALRDGRSVRRASAVHEVPLPTLETQRAP